MCDGGVGEGGCVMGEGGCDGEWGREGDYACGGYDTSI